MKYLYDNSKAVKINNEMRTNLNFYNQRNNEITNLTNEIVGYQKELEEKNHEIEALETAVNSEDKKVAKDANKKLKGLQKETDKIISLIKNNEDRKLKLEEKQNSAYVDGVQNKIFPEKEETNVVETTVEVPAAIGEYKEEDSFVPVETEMKIEENTNSLSEEDLDAIWNKLHTTEESNVEEADMKENIVTPVYDEPKAIEPVYDETPEVNIETPVSIFGESADLVQEETPEPIVETTTELEEVEENNAEIELPEKEEPIITELETPAIEEATITEEEPSIIEPTVIAEDGIITEEVSENELPPLETESIVVPDNESLQEKIHNKLEEEFPKIEVPEPMESEGKLQNIYEEVDVEPKLLDKSKTRDLKNLTLFVDYNDYTFTFAQQHYNKEALTPEEIEKLQTIKSYLTEANFNTKRTIQYNKITAENKRLNRKIVTLSKEFTKTVDKLSKDYVTTTDELTRQTNKAKEQIEIDRVEKVQTQRLNDSLTDNIKEQNEHIDNLTQENNKLKETIEARDNKIKDLQNEIKDKAEKIKVFEEKLNTVLGIVKEVKGEKKAK